MLADKGAMLTLQDVQVYAGKAPFGGGITTLGNLKIISGELRGNEATEKAGGAVSAQGQVTITGSFIGQNDAAQYGGALALAVNGGPAHIQDSTFSYNHAGSDGGAINALAPVTISGGDFYTNTATSKGGDLLGKRRSPYAIVRCARTWPAPGAVQSSISNRSRYTHTSLLANRPKTEYGGAIYATATVLLDRNIFEASSSPLAGTVLFLGQRRRQSGITNNLWLDNFTDGFPKQPALCAPCD